MAEQGNDRGISTIQTSSSGNGRDRVGLRGCFELIIKLIILLILIGALISYLLTQQERNPWVIAVLAALILLVLGLIYRQGHFVNLTCKLIAPTGCVHGDPSVLPNYVLEPILGTASGTGFSHYELEVVYKGVVIPNAVIYADSSGNPDTAATQGNHQVSSGTLGWVNIHEAAKGAGADLLNTTNFVVRLFVYGKDNSKKPCSTAFELSAASSFIKKVGRAWSHRYYIEEEPLLRPDPPATPPSPLPTTASTPADDKELSSVGGGIFVRGAANAYGCSGEKIEAVRVWSIPGFGFGQPANGTPTPVLASMPTGSEQISEVLYSNDDQRQHNVLNGASSEGNILTYQAGWFQRWEAQWVDFGMLQIYLVPDIREKTWATPASGKYTLLLQVQDTLGNTYYDVQRVWVDNDPVEAEITSIGGLTACKDLNLKNYVGTTAEIRGIAWDPLIDAGDTNRPSNNFGNYTLRFQKNGGGDAGITVATPNVVVPNMHPLPSGTDGVLANWDVVAAIDGGAGPVPANSEKLARGDRCAYVIDLDVSDRTQVGEGGSGHHKQHLYAINVINDL